VSKIKIGITGQSGFIGTHLYNALGLDSAKHERIPFVDHYFDNHDMLCAFVKQCDVIVHFAAVNRHSDPDKLYEINIELVNLLIDALNQENVKPHIIFSSSSQENQDNPYGKSKYEGRRLFEKWACENNASFTGLIIPNVFGPFCVPNYNSFVATFCHKLTHGEKPNIITDNEINMIYVSSLCGHILSDVNDVSKANLPIVKEKLVPHDFSRKVSEILVLCNIFKEQYFDNGIIPHLASVNEINLFNTFRSYIDIDNYFPYVLKQNIDKCGNFVETIRLRIGGQVSFSTTKSGVTRGNHYHTRKIERFVVLKGKAIVQLRKIGTEKIYEFYFDGKNHSYIDMPIWYTHNITNVGHDDLYTQFWINEWYDESNPDTFFEKV